MSEDSKYQRFLQSFFKNELLPAHQRELEQWLSENGISLEQIREFKSYDEFVRQKAVFDHVDKEKAWEKLSRAIDARKTRVVSARWWYGVAAAAVIAVAALGGLLMYEHDRDGATPIVAPVTVAEITIETESGEQIAVGHDEEMKMLEVDGANLVIDAGQATYNVDEVQTERVSINKLIVPRGKEFQMTLADGTKIYVNAESSLSYPTNFSDSLRKITLLAGEVYLEVAHDKRKPFIVQINGVNIHVLGTRFNVNAYPETNQTVVTLLEGAVSLESDDVHAAFAPLLMKPGQEARISADSGQLLLREVDTNAATAWVRGEFIFEKQRLDTIMQLLAHWYDIDAEFADDSLREILFTGKIRRYNQIDPFLDAVERIAKIRIEREGNKLFVKKNTDQ